MKKRVIILLVCLFSFFTITSCSLGEKEFSNSGITITLNKSFYEKEIVQVPFYLESIDHIFMGMRESKGDLSNILNLEQYIKAVLSNNMKEADINYFDEDGVNFYYAYYTSVVDKRDYGYMLIAKEGAGHFYSMNFGCLEKNLDSNKKQYIEWAKTIVVE